MKNYLKRLNWSGSFVMFIICGLGAMSRTQDPTLMESIYVWVMVGIPVSILILFIGMEPKD